MSQMTGSRPFQFKLALHTVNSTKVRTNMRQANLSLSLFSLSLFGLAAGTCSLAAQSGDGEATQTPVDTPKRAPAFAGPQTTGPQVTALLPVPGNAWRTPIHTWPADPVGGEYGTWTSGLSYKASFHDGFAFYPFLGAAYPENLPLRWTTESVTAGGEPIVDVNARPQQHRADWRYEYRFGGMTEAYDVREEGVEQLFVIWHKPVQQGDLVVTGRVTTNLRVATAAPASAAHQALTFSDAKGEPLVRYGEAFAIDAVGRRSNVLTSFDGARIRLTVPAAFIAAASFPLTIDPLTTRVIISTWGGATFGLASYPEVGRDDESTADNLMAFYSRQFSAADFDAYARLSNDDFSGSSVVFNDVTTSWSTIRAGVAFVGAADRWALCLQRDFPATGANTVRVRVYFHDKANTTLNSGLVVFHDPGVSECNWYPSVGGTNGFSATGVNALLAYQADVTATQSNTTTSNIYTVLVNCSTRTIGTRVEVDNGIANDDNEFPDVNQESNGGTASWMVAWEQFNNAIALDDVDVIVSRRTSTNGDGGHFFMGPAGGAPAHKLQPQVGGRNGRYCVSMVRSATRSSVGGGFGSEVLVERFNWSDTATTPTKLGPKTLISDTSPADFVNGGIAHDDNSSSHWAIVYQRGGFTAGDTFVVRVGYTGGDTESGTLYNGPNGSWSPNVAFNDDADEFQCVYGSNDNPPSGLPVYGQRLQYPATAINVPYGTGCGPGTISASNPFAGSEFFRINLGGVAAATPGVLLLSLGSGSIPLDFIGMTGCVANFNPAPAAFLFSLGSTAGAGISFPLPDDPLFTGNLFVQWGYLAAGLNPANIGATQGLRIQVR